jgi:hypothetical protein
MLLMGTAGIGCTLNLEDLHANQGVGIDLLRHRRDQISPTNCKLLQVSSGKKRTQKRGVAIGVCLRCSVQMEG